MAELLARARSEAARCIDDLNRKVDTFDDYARRGEDLAGRLHHEVLASRMRPMSEGVRGFPRMVREVARELGKKVRFEVRGENTGVDRDILDKLEAPLNHLIRNALDHAIETARGTTGLAGKDPTGLIRLEARHSAGMLQITVTDDGRGVDPAGSATRSSARGWPRPRWPPAWARPELLEFLFLPGLLDQGGRDRDLRPGGRASTSCRTWPGPSAAWSGSASKPAGGPGSRSSCPSRCRSSGPSWSRSPASRMPSR